MGKRRDLYQSRHPFDENPFEVLCTNSWQAVTSLRINQGSMTVCTIDDRFVISNVITSSHIRLKSRQANFSDCTCFLRPGIDVCVLTPTDDLGSSEELPSLVWMDARITSIERKPHEFTCSCRFYVKLYTYQGPLASDKHVLSKDTDVVGIDQIAILQRLESKQSEGQPHRWKFSEDCPFIQRTKILMGKFLCDLSWLIVASALKQVQFNIRSVENKLIYEILGHNDGGLYAVNFRIENDVMIPVVIQHFTNKAIEAGEGHHDDDDDNNLTLSDVMVLRRSKRRNIQPDRFLACDVSKLNVCIHQPGIYRVSRHNYEGSEEEENEEDEDELSVPLSRLFQRRTQSHRRDYSRVLILRDEKQKTEQERSADVGRRKVDGNKVVNLPNKLSIVPRSALEAPRRYQRHSNPPESRPHGRMDEDDFLGYNTVDLLAERCGRFPASDNPDFEMRVNSLNRKGPKRKYSFPINKRERMTEERIYGQRTLSAGLYKDLINSYMKNLEHSVTEEDPSLLNRWKAPSTRKYVNSHVEVEWEPIEEEGEDPEIEMLWREMELAMTSSYLFEDIEGLKDQPPNVQQDEKPMEVCQHDFRLNEEIGLLCRFCGVVGTEIQDMVPEFLQTAQWAVEQKSSNVPAAENVEAEEEEDAFAFDTKRDISDNNNAAEENENVWTLIPELRKKLHLHQKRAFEFLWKNITGSLEPSKMATTGKKASGCVVSHSPGAGKTFLIIAFLVSYLKLFPEKRPLVLAPKTTLYTWHKEFVKWEIPIPVYMIHGRRSYRVLTTSTISFGGLPKPGQDVMHVLDCLEKIQKWHAHPSVLVMGYTSFLTLMRDDSKFAHRKHMAKVLRESPGILILDEGHNPRSTKSRLRKSLMKVETDLRVLLSGTVFQNNFCEYFNTLCLARPSFVNEVLLELDPKFRKKKKRKARNLLESRARKFFIDNIGRKIDSSNNEERMQGLDMLKNITNGFIDVYEGGASDVLPGLQSYTLLMNPTDIQNEVLLKLHRIMRSYHGYPLELELLITLGSIHPWLIKTACCAGKFFSRDELMKLDKHRFEIKKGSKVKFVLSLVYRVFQREKVLIFCHNIAPIHLFLELFERIFGWRKGSEVLVLSGDLELFERGKIMDRFEEPGHPSRVLIASITACAEGISLTAASRVILLDSEWNPSKTKQAIARAFRPGQQKMVYVYQLLAANTLEEDKYRRTTWKEWVSCMIFSEAFVEDPSCWQAPKIEDEILREMVEEDRSKSIHMILKNEKASTN